MFRADFAWPEHRVILEVQGGVWIGGRHTSGQGYENDCERRCLAVIEGWRMLEVTPRHVKSGMALDWIIKALGVRDKL